MIEFLFKHTPLYFFSQSFWRDEAFSYLMARQNIGELLSSTARDFAPPLYYLVLHFWMKIVGSSEIAIRSVSLIFFYATLYVVDHYFTDVLKIKTRWRFLYLLLFFINPFLTYYAYEARAYAMLAFFGTLSFYAFKKKSRNLYIASTVLGLYTHYFMALVILAQVIFSLVRRKFKHVFPWFAITLVFFAPWVIYVLMNDTSYGNAFWISFPSINTLLSAPAIILTGYEEVFHLQNYAILPLTILICFSVVLVLFGKKIIKKNSGDVLYLILWSFFPAALILLLSAVKPLFLPRYFIFSSVGLTLLLVHSIHHSKPAIKTILFVLLFATLIHYNVLQLEDRHKGNVKSVVAEITKIIGKNDLVYVESELDFHTAQYYFDSNRVYIYRKAYSDIPTFVGKVLIPESHVVSTLPIFPRKAYIIHRDLSYDIESMN